MEEGALQSSAHRQSWERLPKDVGTHSGPTVSRKPTGFSPGGFWGGREMGVGEMAVHFLSHDCFFFFCNIRYDLFQG